MSLKRIRVGPLTLELTYRDLYPIIRGFRVALRCSGKPIDPSRIPEGWELRRSMDSWPSGYAHPTNYWITIWKERSVDGAHMAIMPQTDGWRVEYDPKNSWAGGDTIARELEFDEAIDIAIKAMERLNATHECVRLNALDYHGSSS